MQRAYFLGGSGPNGFVTAFPSEQKESYGILLKGGPGTGKSTLMKKLAAAFPDERVSVYHCASDPRSLDAVVFDERGVYVADATAPHEQSTPLPYVTGELCDLAQGLDAETLKADRDAVLRLYRQNQDAHALARQCYAGQAAMEAVIGSVGKRALLKEKLAGYAKRFTKRIIQGKAEKTGALYHRQCTAATPSGQLTLIPEQFQQMILHDPCMTAAPALLAELAAYAVKNGYTAECTASLILPDAPLTAVILPEQQLAVIAAPAFTEHSAAHTAAVEMKRFYAPELLRAERTLLRFCRKAADTSAQRITALLQEALSVHDALELYYIRALDTGYLNAAADALIARIAEFPRT